MTNLPAISLWQPWASLLFTPDAKVHETRHWAVRPSLLGQRVLIHAAKTNQGFRGMEEGDELARLCAQKFPLGFTLPRGAFIGTATLAACFRIAGMETRQASDNDFTCGNWAPGRYAWRFDDRTAFATPIPAKGQQGWWTAEVDLP